VICVFLAQTIPAVACSCFGDKSDLLKIPGLISFDGRVIDISSFEDNTADVVFSRINVVRSTRKGLGPEIKIVTNASSAMCGAAYKLVRAHEFGRIREFHVLPTQPDIYTSLPPGELYLSMCGVYASELDPDLPRLPNATLEIR
jgi:hypothetical protein